MRLKIKVEKENCIKNFHFVSTNTEGKWTHLYPSEIGCLLENKTPCHMSWKSLGAVN